MAKVFVYGTLRRGQGNNYLLGRSPFIGEAISLDRHYWLTGHSTVPFLSEAEARNSFTGAIRGELYDVDAATLERLDQLEGHPHWYERKMRRFRIVNGFLTTAWVYLIPHRANRNEAPRPPERGVLTYPKQKERSYA